MKYLPAVLRWGLVLAGIILLGGPHSTLLTPIGEALLIAGLLALIVDPVVKRHLLKEASKGIFHYMVGFDQRPEIRERLKTIVFNTKLYREGYEIKCRIERQVGGRAKLNFQNKLLCGESYS
jgi:hypothetical protein